MLPALSGEFVLLALPRGICSHDFSKGISLRIFQGDMYSQRDLYSWLFSGEFLLPTFPRGISAPGFPRRICALWCWNYHPRKQSSP